MCTFVLVSFNYPTFEDAIYTPAAGEFGIVVLTLTAYPIDPCVTEYSDSMELLIVKKPSIELAESIKLGCADYDEVNNQWYPVCLNPIIENGTTILWETTGDGTFDDPGIQNPCYTLGIDDINQGEVELCVSVTGQSGCQFVAEKCIKIYLPLQLINFTNNTWYGVSSYLQPDDPSVIDVLDPIVLIPGSQNLVIIFNELGQFYRPEVSPPINTIGDWDQVGYKAKIKNAPACLPIYGDLLDDLSFTIEGTHTYLPVLTNVATNIEQLFGNDLSKVLLMYDWSTGQLWTQVAQDFNELVPGKAYLLISNDPSATYTIEFPDYDQNAPPEFNNVLVEADISSPWNDFETTSQTHFFLFADEAISNLQAGDIIGAFNQNGNCVGISEFAGRNSFYKLVAMGDDTNTPEIEGFKPGEIMTFKLYRKATGQTYDVSFTYDVDYPNYDGLFAIYGVSRITGITTGISSINDNKL